MKVMTKEGIQKLEALAMQQIGIPEIILMENAAIGIAENVTRHYPLSKRILIYCGKGNNGGDGFAAARLLHCMGKQVHVVPLFGKNELTLSCRINHDIAQRMGLLKHDPDISQYDLIIDALLGYGINGAPHGKIKEAIVHINESGKTIVSIDLPSGGLCDSGEVLGECVRANLTIALCCPKIGFYMSPLNEYVGEVAVASISIPEELHESHYSLFTHKEAASLLPKRSVNLHKSSSGRLLIAAGSESYTGAPILAAQAAMRSGVGYVTLAVPDTITDIMRTRLTEPVIKPCKSQGGTFASPSEVISYIKGSDAFVIGCGICVNNHTRSIIREVISSCEIPLIIDADALNAIADEPSILRQAKCPVAITPHIGEMSRLTGLSNGYISSNRLLVAVKFALEYNVTVVLKGANTAIAAPDGSCYINTSGNNGMATAGTGDVLAGMVGAYAAQGVPLPHACALAAYLHGKAADLAAAAGSESALIATDITGFLGQAQTDAAGCF